MVLSIAWEEDVKLWCRNFEERAVDGVGRRNRGIGRRKKRSELSGWRYFHEKSVPLQKSSRGVEGSPGALEERKEILYTRNCGAKHVAIWAYNVQWQNEAEARAYFMIFMLTAPLPECKAAAPGSLLSWHSPPRTVNLYTSKSGNLALFTTNVTWRSWLP